MNNEPFAFHGDLNNFLLFKRLREKLGPNCILQATQTKATESRAIFNEAVEKYFKNFILMDIVSAKCSTTLSQENRILSSHESSDEATVFQSHPLHLNPFKMHLNPFEMPLKQSTITNELRCQGIDEEYLSKLLNKRKKEKSLRLTKEVEAGIKEFCNTLPKYSLCLSSLRYVSEGNWIKGFKEFVKEQVSHGVSLEAENATIQSNKKVLNDMILTYYKELAEGISLLYDLISLHEEKLQMQLHFSQFVSLKSEAISLKLKLVELKIFTNTYTEDSISALRVISSKTKEVAKQSSKELEDKRAVLRAYEILGPNYEKLVERYSQLLSDIKRLKYSIKTLENRPEN